MWDNLGKHLRAGLVLSIILVIGAAAASFTLSFVALKEVASTHALGWGQTAWVFPCFVDVGLIGCEVTLLSLSMMSNTGLQRLMAAGGMLMFGALTIYYNATRVPAEWRMVTAAPPLGGIILTLMFAMLLKAFAAHTGIAWQQQGAPQAHAALGPPGGPIQGYAWRPDQAPYGAPYAMPGSPFPGVQQQMPPQWAPYGQMPSPTTPGNGHLDTGNGSTKRAAIDAYLSRLDTEQLQVQTGPSIVEAVSAAGVQVDERDARRQLDAAKQARLPSPRKRGRG
jgi:hypothetical protein